jgi:hypothetical protein
MIRPVGCRRVIYAVAGAVLLLGGSALPRPAIAQDSQPVKSWYYVNGAPGADVARPFDPTFPLDAAVSFNGVNHRCLRKEISFGNIAGPEALYDSRPGPIEEQFEFRFYAANAANPCGGPLYAGRQLGVRREPRAIVVGLASGRAATQLFVFDMDLSPVPEGVVRLTVAHAADAPTVSVATVAGRTDAAADSTGLDGIARGQQKQATRQPGTYQAYVYAGESPTGTPLAGPIEVKAPPRSVTLMYVVGRVESGSLTIIMRTIPDVF